MSQQSSARSRISNGEEQIDVSHGLNITVWPPRAVTLASVTYHWPLTFVSKLLDERCVSDAFVVAGFSWRLSFKARGAFKDKSQQEWYSSFFLESVDARQANGPLATFSLGVINQDFPEQCLWRPCQHTFNQSIPDWGFARMIALSDLIDPKRGFVVNDTIVLGVRF